MRGDQIPRAYTTGEWPHDAVPNDGAPVAVHYSLALARALSALVKERGLSQRRASMDAGLSAPTVGRIVRGEVYPDLATLARLEAALQADLYPAGLHRRTKTPTTSMGPSN
ncbi:helix-turn-helix domain-containing protein [Streptomyces sp. NPDC002536]